MKTPLLSFLVFAFLFSCNHPDLKSAVAINSQLTALAPGKERDKETTSANPVKNNNVNFILAKNTVTGWTPEEKSTFMNACEEGTVETMGENRSTNYCACLLTKLEKLYPVADDVINLPDKTQEKLSKDCMR